jgi:hypothetical protein
MNPHDAIACRRALREIREIVAVALLDGSRMTEQEALQTIAAIADWAAEDAPSDPADCGDVIRRLDGMIGTTDLDEMDDGRALGLFRDVTALLQTPPPSAVIGAEPLRAL